MSDPIDKTLDEYLRGNSRISQHYRELDDGAAVPPQLDQRVLAQARAAVAAQQTAHTEEHMDELAHLRQRRRRLMRWGVPVGLAASAVLVVSIVVRSGVMHSDVMQHESVSLPQQSTVSAPAAREPRERASDQASSAVPTQSAATPVPSRASPAVSADVLRGQVDEQVRSNARPLRQQQSAPPAVPAAPTPVTRPALASSVAAPAPPPPVGGSSRIAASAPQAISEDVGHSTSSHASSVAAGEETIARQAKQARNNGLRAVAQTAAAQQQPAEPHAEPGVDYDLAEASVAGSDPRGTAGQSAPAASQSDAETETQSPEEPEHWLERIRQLRKDGKSQDADREWQRFREVYPDHGVAETDAARAKP